jgi:hypothetical protein
MSGYIRPVLEGVSSGEWYHLKKFWEQSFLKDRSYAMAAIPRFFMLRESLAKVEVILKSTRKINSLPAVVRPVSYLTIAALAIVGSIDHKALKGRCVQYVQDNIGVVAELVSLTSSVAMVIFNIAPVFASTFLTCIALRVLVDRDILPKYCISTIMKTGFILNAFHVIAFAGWLEKASWVSLVGLPLLFSRWNNKKDQLASEKMKKSTLEPADIAKIRSYTPCDFVPDHIYYKIPFSPEKVVNIKDLLSSGLIKEGCLQAFCDDKGYHRGELDGKITELERCAKALPFLGRYINQMVLELSSSVPITAERENILLQLLFEVDFDFKGKALLQLRQLFKRLGYPGLDPRDKALHILRDIRFEVLFTNFSQESKQLVTSTGCFMLASYVYRYRIVDFSTEGDPLSALITECMGRAFIDNIIMGDYEKAIKKNESLAQLRRENPTRWPSVNAMLVDVGAYVLRPIATRASIAALLARDDLD